MIEIREATEADAAALAALRALFLDAPATGEAFTHEVEEWLERGGRAAHDLARRARRARLGMASLFEYRRMPKPGLPPLALGLRLEHVRREEARDTGDRRPRCSTP